MEPLATPTQLADRMTSTPAPPERVEAALADASAAVRGYTGQVFTRATSTVPLRAFCRGQVRLPQRPVLAVGPVTAPAPGGGTAEVGFFWNGTDRIVIADCFDHVTATWEHGYDALAMPDDVVAVVCNIAARSLSSAPEDAGVTSRTITNYTEGFGPVGAAGPVGMFNDERLLLDRYRRPGMSARVC